MKAALKLLVLVAFFFEQMAAHCPGNNYGSMESRSGKPRQSNWKQCTWTNVNDDKDNGEVHECLFFKKLDNSYLRVSYQGNVRVLCNNCCKRWFFTFNKKECSSPAAIDAVVYHHFPSGSPNIHRPVTQEGYCGGIGKGIVRVGYSVGNCVGFKSANAYTSWNSVSRIMIEEVEGPQA